MARDCSEVNSPAYRRMPVEKMSMTHKVEKNKLNSNSIRYPEIHCTLARTRSTRRTTETSMPTSAHWRPGPSTIASVTCRVFRGRNAAWSAHACDVKPCAYARKTRETTVTPPVWNQSRTLVFPVFPRIRFLLRRKQAKSSEFRFLLSFGGHTEKDVFQRCSF